MHIIYITVRVWYHQWYPPSLTCKIAHDHLTILHVFSWIYASFPQFSNAVGIDLACDYNYNEGMVISNQLLWGVTKTTTCIASLFRCSNFPLGWMVPCKQLQSNTILQVQPKTITINAYIILAWNDEVQPTQLQLYFQQ